MAGLRHDAGIVAAIGEQEGQLVVGEQLNLVDRAPGRDVVGLGADHEHRRLDVFQRNHLALDGVAAGGEPVLQEQPAQILRVHAVREPRLIGVPGAEIGDGIAFAEQIFAHHLRPDEVVGAQDLEGAGHLLGVEHALVPHHVLEEGDLAFVDEQHQLAGLAEIGLRREQRDGGEPVIVFARHGRRGDGEQRAADAIADSVDLLGGQDGIDGIERRHDAFSAIGVEGDVAVLRRRVPPGHHEHGEAALDQIAHQRIVRGQIEHVIFHDPGRDDQHRLGHDALSGRFVLDELHQLVAEHDLARRDGEVLAHFQSVGGRLGLHGERAPEYLPEDCARHA